jgi:hypothetical protein
MQINPLHFNGGRNSGLFTKGDFPCEKVWPRHSWQSQEQASWEDLALAIRDAEQTLGQWLNYNVAPMWSIEEEHRFPRYWNGHFTNAININGQRAGVFLQKGRIIAGGQRLATTIHAGVTVVYSDEDADGYSETATITATIPGTVTVSDWRNVRVFYEGRSADPRWEIRPLTTVTVAGSTITIVAKAYLFVDQDLRAAMTAVGGFDPLDFDDLSALVATVDVYLITNDTTNTASRMVWEMRPLITCSVCSGVGCDECGVTTQNGCLVVRDGNLGYVVPTPATYDSGWASDTLSIGRSPDKVFLWYYSGNVGEDYRMNLSNDPLDYWLAQAIAWMATSRLDREVCHCNSDHFDWLQQDMAFVSPAGNFLTIAEPIQQAPFGTRRGEWLAYQKVRHTAKHITVGIL